MIRALLDGVGHASFVLVCLCVLAEWFVTRSLLEAWRRDHVASRMIDIPHVGWGGGYVYMRELADACRTFRREGRTGSALRERAGWYLVLRHATHAGFVAFILSLVARMLLPVE